MAAGIEIAPAGPTDLSALAALRLALWPDADELDANDLAEAGNDHHPLHLLAREPGGTAIGFAEVALRHDYVNGCETSPVGFLEGLYVIPAHRRQGIARALVATARDWALARGCAELASDALIDNHPSHAAHIALCFAETERVVYFRMALAGADPGATP